ncbi:SpoIIE family protein phosphatase [Streptomyces sp. NPDC059835]|uniref:SpoIIE family protein phosphatase n=1 Tax=Streptomyces sp. NPDC059835 TaxID=3346967 RepID=UPI0036486412
MTWRHRFTRGDVLLLVTDGLVEARSPDGIVYPPREPTAPPLRGPSRSGTRRRHRLPQHRPPRHTRNLHDDVTMLAIAPQGSRLTHHRHIRRGMPSPTASLTHQRTADEKRSLSS